MENEHPVEETEKIVLPTTEELVEQLERERYRFHRFKALRRVILFLIVAVAVAVFVLILLMPTIQINGNSMEPQLKAGDVVLTQKGKDVESGDVVVFYYNDKILVKRLIGNSGDWVDIDDTGDVYVNGELLDEPYVAKKSLGECDIDLPYHVPEGRIFVMGDQRSESIDSRYSSVGCIDKEQVVGKLVFRIWPIGDIGIVN